MYHAHTILNKEASLHHGFYRKIILMNIIVKPDGFLLILSVVDFETII